MLIESDWHVQSQKSISATFNFHQQKCKSMKVMKDGNTIKMTNHKEHLCQKKQIYKSLHKKLVLSARSAKSIKKGKGTGNNRKKTE